ncbi:Uncharacterised protein [Bordetella pertussis]|nr:Uncharacterised protein [Bordetella pertussis]CFU02574.1 Uncharacterised protein [Bordetella pertussis]CFW04689.1 Uncharacterised protein [Bordetella pertussis]CFW42373.1 Uncharacterised protein [Bordetella pertussis]
MRTSSFCQGSSLGAYFSMKYSRFSSGSGGNTARRSPAPAGDSWRGTVRHRSLYCRRACSSRSAWRCASSRYEMGVGRL